MSMAIICPACHYENPSDAEFCDACGYELSTASGSPEPTAPTVVQPPEPIFTPPPPQPAPQPNYPAPTFPTSAPTAKLICKQAGAPTSEFPLDSNMLIGKFDPDSGPVDIDLEGFPDDEKISRQHGEIYLEGGVWKIKDIGSSNGIFIKRSGESRFGARITIPEILNGGDEIAIAHIKFLFQSP
jgi:hypothetical protein